MLEHNGVARWTAGDIAQRLGLDRETARLVMTSDDFPKPVLHLPHQWLVADVEEWVVEHRPDGAA